MLFLWFGSSNIDRTGIGSFRELYTLSGCILSAVSKLATGLGETGFENRGAGRDRKGPLFWAVTNTEIAPHCGGSAHILFLKTQGEWEVMALQGNSSRLGRALLLLYPVSLEKQGSYLKTYV